MAADRACSSGSTRREGPRTRRLALRSCCVLAALAPLGADAASDLAAAGILGDGVALLQSSPAAGSIALDEDAWGSADGFQPLRSELLAHTWYHLHTPRTAGTSFYRDAKRIFKNKPSNTLPDSRMLSKEGCYNWYARIKHIRVEAVAVMVREPRAHVFSQYLFCSEGSVSELTQVRNISQWLQEWTRLKAEGMVVGNFAHDNGAHNDLLFPKYVTFTSLPFHCYNPINLQTHRLTCDYPFEYPQKAGIADLAIKNMQAATFVGISEAYQESMCVFYSHVYAGLPDFCDCRNQTAWQSFHGEHSAFHHLHANVSSELAGQPQEVLSAIDALTKEDVKLYRAALKRFRQDVRGVEEKYGTKLSCNAEVFGGK